MDRFTVSLEAELLQQFDDYIRRRGYKKRSEAVRDILREKLEAERLAEERGGHCIACLSYIYNHHERQLARRLTQASHDHHDLTLSTVHVHLDHENCMEVAILRGPTAEVGHFADSIIGETGVRHGKLNAVPVEVSHGAHAHAHAHAHAPAHDHRTGRRHLHSRPKT